MLFSFETPQQLLKFSRNYNDYDYYLDVFDDEETKDFFKESLKMGRTVYLDNSLFERVRYNLPHDESKFLSVAEELHECGGDLYIVAPDFINSSEKNIQKAEEWIKKYPDFKFILTVHGDSKQDYIHCFNELNKFDSKHIIALSWIDKFMFLFSRAEFLDKFDLNERKIHIFGLRYPTEIFELRPLKNKIFSIDTSLPISATLEEGNLQHYLTYDIKPKLTMYEAFYEPVHVCCSQFLENIKALKTAFQI